MENRENHLENNIKWLVLDVDECLYNKTYQNDNKSIKFGDAFITIHTEIIQKYLDTINNRMNFTFDIDSLVNYLKNLNGGLNSIIGLIILLEKLNIHFSMSEYHNIMFKSFRYDKITQNSNINKLITKAQSYNMKVAIFSNGSYPHIMKCLNQLGVNISLLDYISCLEFTSKQVINEQKPSMFSYINFQNEINALPKNIYFFDDNYNNCKTANNLGWNTILVNDKNNEDDVRPVNTKKHKQIKIKNKMFNLKNINKKYIHSIPNIDKAIDLIHCM